MLRHLTTRPLAIFFLIGVGLSSSMAEEGIRRAIEGQLQTAFEKAFAGDGTQLRILVSGGEGGTNSSDADATVRQTIKTLASQGTCLGIDLSQSTWVGDRSCRMDAVLLYEAGPILFRMAVSMPEDQPHIQAMMANSLDTYLAHLHLMETEPVPDGGTDLAIEPVGGLFSRVLDAMARGKFTVDEAADMLLVTSMSGGSLPDRQQRMRTLLTFIHDHGPEAGRLKSVSAVRFKTVGESIRVHVLKLTYEHQVQFAFLGLYRTKGLWMLNTVSFKPAAWLIGD